MLCSALLRRSIETVSFSKPLSMSRSMALRLIALMTFWYAACVEATSVQDAAISVPDAPPNDAITSPPWLRRPATLYVVESDVSPFHIGLQVPPPLMMKASVQNLLPVLEASEPRSGLF